MKFLVLLGVLAMRYTAAKSWNGDSYSEETFCVLGWFGYLKRLSLVALMLSGVVLYYVPESRSHARRACYVMIDFTANGLKSVLCPEENDRTHGRNGTRYHGDRWEKVSSSQRRLSLETQKNNEDLVSRGYNKSKIGGDDEDGSVRAREKERIDWKRKKEEKKERECRQSRRKHRLAVGKDVSVESCKDVVQPSSFYAGELEEVRRYLSSRFCDPKGMDETTMENYAFLISGSPRQMAMIDQKFEKDDVVVFQGASFETDSRECSTSTGKLSGKQERTHCDQGGRIKDDCNSITTNLTKESYDGRGIGPPEAESTRYKSMHQSGRYRRDGERKAKNRSPSFVNFNNREGTREDTREVTRLSQNIMNTATFKREEAMNDNSFVSSYNNHDRGEDPRSHRKDVDGPQTRSQKMRMKNVESLHPYEDVARSSRKIRKSPTDDTLEELCCNSHFCCTDPEVEAADENSLDGTRVTARHDLNDRPRRESRAFPKSSEDTIFYDYDYARAPMMSNRVKPALVRAVNWIFGGCPEAARRAKMKCNEVGKEEIQGVTDGWLR